MLNFMNEQVPKGYRDNLAEKLNNTRKIGKDGKVLAQDFLEKIQTTPEYQKAKEDSAAKKNENAASKKEHDQYKLQRAKEELDEILHSGKVQYKGEWVDREIAEADPNWEG